LDPDKYDQKQGRYGAPYSAYRLHPNHIDAIMKSRLYERSQEREMARSVAFEGYNTTLGAPKGEEDTVDAMHAFDNGSAITSCWELSPFEMEEVLRTGRIYLTIMSRTVFPSFIGGEMQTRDITSNCGKCFPRQIKKVKTI
jgi:hypothetical protein